MSNNSHCVYLNTPVGGGGVRHTVFVLFGLIQKITSTKNHFNNQLLQPQTT